MSALITRAPVDGPVAGELRLPFELRTRTRVLARMTDGTEVAVMLERGGPPLADGDVLAAADGRRVRIRADDEDLLHVTCADATALARAAYHLGNRHVKVEVGDGWLRIASDSVLEGMLRQLGASVTDRRAPFAPEHGAYGAGHHHSHGGEEGARYAPRIHDFVARDR